ncbi:hypothetical protein [Aureispira sp. CCB-QB1]|uniref:hypothetical protein n=1 Tax=Aureispira sp. CCB-QB1 TaxID=1313421 RepID=UPI00069686A5|nr:hypothetical protein [Aureispira sp. CCB-QB1]
MNSIYIFAGLIGLLLIPYLTQNPFDWHQTQVLKEGSTTYYIIPELELNTFQENSSHLFTIEPVLEASSQKQSFQWGKNTERIQTRVAELRQESSMFNQILTHLEESEYPYSINNTPVKDAYGTYSSKNGTLKFGVDQMHDFFFDATIIEEFAHAYQALYYNYTHGRYRAKREQESLQQGKDYSKARKKGLLNWKKFGQKHAFIESEAKLMTYFIQHQTCGISVQDIIDTDDYNTGGKGRKIIHRYLKRNTLYSNGTTTKRLGHLAFYWIDLPTFALYQQQFVQHWRRKAPGSSYTIGYFYHKPDALNNIYQPICKASPALIDKKQMVIKP